MGNDITKTYSNPLDVRAADPFVLLHDSVYYLYCTYDPAPNLGIPVFTSKDLVNWEKHTRLAFTKTRGTRSQHHFWGPEVIHVNGEFLMYYNASPNRTPDPPSNMHLCIAKSDSPLGPFIEVKAPFYGATGDDEAIDQNIFIDDDDTAYLYFTLITKGRNEIQAVRLKENLIEFDGEPVPCIRPTQPWESHAWEGHVVAEGAFVLKHQGPYYLTYTANHFLDPNYAIGYAVSEFPLGPWEKFEDNPILSKTDYIHGPGNGMFVPSPDGSETFIVYHTHNSTTAVMPRKLAIDRARFVPADGGPDILVVDGPTHTPQPLPASASL